MHSPMENDQSRLARCTAFSLPCFFFSSIVYCLGCRRQRFPPAFKYSRLLKTWACTCKHLRRTDERLDGWDWGFWMRNSTGVYCYLSQLVPKLTFRSHPARVSRKHSVPQASLGKYRIEHHRYASQAEDLRLGGYAFLTAYADEAHSICRRR